MPKKKSEILLFSIHYTNAVILHSFSANKDRMKMLQLHNHFNTNKTNKKKINKDTSLIGMHKMQTIL